MRKHWLNIWWCKAWLDFLMYEHSTVTGFFNKNFFLSETNINDQTFALEILCLWLASKQFCRERCKGGLIKCQCGCELGFPSGSAVKNPLSMQQTQETWLPSLDKEDPLEKEMATHSNILAWRIPWTEESGVLQSIESQRVGHSWSDLAHTHMAVSWRVLGWITGTCRCAIPFCLQWMLKITHNTLLVGM